MLYAVTFDFWGTLYQNASARDERLHLLEEILTRHAQPRPWADLEAAYRHGRSVFEHSWREERRSITTERWLREMLAFLEAVLFLGVSQRQDGQPLADAVFEEYHELEELLERLE